MKICLNRIQVDANNVVDTKKIPEPRRAQKFLRALANRARETSTRARKICAARNMFCAHAQKNITLSSKGSRFALFVANFTYSFLGKEPS